MRDPVVVVGLGQMGAVFSHALLRAGHPVFPVTRGESVDDVEVAVGSPEVVLVAVGEGALAEVLGELPASWRGRVALLSNELAPPTWRAHGISSPTLLAVWFEKKKGTAVRVVRPTVASGPHAELFVEALGGIGIPAVVASDDEAGREALVVKNLYILTANIVGLAVGGTTGALAREHADLADAVAREVLAIEACRFDREFDDDALLAEMREAFLADPEHASTGRSARDRLTRALTRADAFGLAVPRLRALSAARETWSTRK